MTPSREATGTRMAEGPGDFAPERLPPAPEPAPLPPPIADPADLRRLPERSGWQELERWLAAFVRFHTEDLEGLRVALKDLADEPTGLHDEREWQHPGQWAEAMARHVVTPGERPGAPRPAEGRLPEASRVSAPHWLLLRRLAELHSAVRGGTPPPGLLATPTTGTGALDAAELVARIEAHERAGAEAMPADLQQALLRLPHEIAPEVAARAGRLTSAAGVTVAGWMSRRPRPRTRVGWSHGSRLYLDDREPGAPHEPSLIPGIRIEPTGLELVDRLLSDPRPSRWQGDGDDPGGWPAMMPHDREAVASHYLPHLLCRWHGSHVRIAHVEALSLADGPAGEGVALLVAHFLLHREWRPDDGVPLLLGLAARGDLPAAEVGRQLALLLRRTWFKPVTMRETLETAAVRGGHEHVWRILTGFLPVYLPGPGERAHTAHTQALAFACRIARWSGARGALPCVAEIAGRDGTSGFVREARRLHALLA
ncbi:hypothetical protein [Nonomuraea sp. LPB2021202275-12-8]|uniref:hypothetical protein n=1 Tax=Nonomuraea sp. LPB2021202275-12-8 TaxID=3120159 RepID=UPI00300CED75